jgi:hypothetical protein
MFWGKVKGKKNVLLNENGFCKERFFQKEEGEG